MNILFIGPYRQVDEWGRKSRAILRGLQNTDHTVTSRPIYLSSSNQYYNYLEKSETYIADNYDLLIQFVLQPFISYHGNFKKNIGIFNSETIPHSIPKGELTSEMLMDEIWTDNNAISTNLSKILQKYGSQTKIKTVPPSLGLDDLPPQHNGSLREQDKSLKDKFIFYWIGNMQEEKGAFKEAYTAYISAFTRSEPVSFCVGLESSLPQEQIQGILQTCQQNASTATSKQDLPPIHILSPQNSHNLSTDERIVIHLEGDCLVDPNYTMVNNCTTLEGALYQSTPLVNKHSSIYQSLGKDHVWGVESYEETCLVPRSTSIYRYTSGESWNKPIIKSLSDTMRMVYVDKFTRDKKQQANSALRQQFKDVSYNDILNG